MLDEALSTFLPSWLVRLDAPTASRDPLSLQAHAMGHADRLLPGLNVFTSRARYYSFLCWALARAQGVAASRGHLERVHRIERLLVLCEAVRHADNPLACSYIGRRRGRRFVAEHDGSGLWGLPVRILKNQASNGAFRLYRSSLADLGLIEEDDLEEGLGLRLTVRGSRLADQFHKTADEGLVAWALDPQTEQRKRRDTIREAAKGMCLSGRMGAHERRQIVDALVGHEGHGIERRETSAILFEHGLLQGGMVGEEIASADPDLAVDDAGRPGEEAAESETRGNWAVIRRALELPPSNRLELIQVAGAYQLAALGLNALLRSALDSVAQHGRLSMAAFRAKVAERAGGGFEERRAIAWAGHRPVVDVAQDLLNGGDRPWPEIASLAMELLLRLGLDERYSRWLSADPAPLVERMLLWTRDAETTPAGAMMERLLFDLVEHHAEVSARKGKGEWLLRDGAELVKNDPRYLRLMLHSLRFAQLQQLATDLGLRAEDVTDET
ncbi:Hypothetical protein A7982_10402 [Minicystis rosea]|nr:Hypothetical protein A7982_10402 [Minicystis rosea]